MRRRWLAVLALAACGGRGSSDGAEPVVKPWVNAAETEEAMADAATAREPARFVKGPENRVTLTFQVDRRPVVATMDVEQIALRVGDVPSLDLPIGHIKLDTTSFSSGDQTRDRVVQALGLRELGAPILVVYDNTSVGNMVGRLATPGATASGEAVGTLQIGTRQQGLGLPARFSRPSAETLVVDAGPFDLDLDQFALGPALDAVALASGVRTIGRTVTVVAHLELQVFTDDTAPLPGFLRTPITVQTVSEIHKRFDEEISDIDAMRARLRAAGVPEATIRTLNDAKFAELSKILERGIALREGRPAGSVLDNPAEQGEPRGNVARPRERMEGGVLIRD